MLRSMYSGISGMKSNQTKMDVVGNNVANVGTTAYKKTSTRFSDALYQTSIYASAPNNSIGGINPSQVGVGTKVSGIFTNMVQGAIQTTGRRSDLAIDGDGFFMVDLGNGEIGYTRDGSFSLDANGQLVTAQGYRVMCITENHTIDIDLQKYMSFTISSEGEVVGIKKDGTKENIDTINRVTFTNPEGLEYKGNNIYVETSSSGTRVSNSPNAGNIIQGAIEMSNVDLSEEFTEMIVTTRAFQAASKVITTSDELLQEIVNLKR